MNNNKLYITDLIDIETLQTLQDGFSEITGMAALTADVNGVAVTQGSHFTDFCMKYTRQSHLGKKKCEQCDKIGAKLTHKMGKACSYFCHAGLIDYAAPIMAGGKIIGSFIGGQALTTPPDLLKIAETAIELGIDPDKYIAAVKKVNILSKEKIDKAAEFLCILASTLSTIAYNNYCLFKSNEKIEKAAKMKSDFLANMSHEIRTPMNAVLGMADLALREQMTPAARDYIHQIKTSGKNLLVIINDILDLSKIESGKMDIIEVEYEPLSLINDLSNVVNTRIGQKDVEFTINISPDLPINMWGDNIRIHQILLNLLTNAVKFTKEGNVHLSITCERESAELCILNVSVSDTGMGIKKENFSKLFDSFQQVDSKRNRNIEGTGLGLPISKQLLSLMNGNINVESNYGKGSTFSFNLPQKIINPSPCASKSENEFNVAYLVFDPYVKKQLITDLEWACNEITDLTHTDINDTDVDYYIVEKKLFTDDIKTFFMENPDRKCLIIEKFNGITDSDLPNVKVIRKPVYSLNLYNAMNINCIPMTHDNKESNNFTFIAPDARILIVDDNNVNLVIAKGLLEPFEMTIDTALSASETLDLVRENTYDIIFMDHMMPDVDGIETTHILRRMIPGCASIPIIALTANAVGEAREMFLREGMNDFVAKPIELKELTSKIRKWLPQDLIVPVKKTIDENDDFEHDNNNKTIEIKGLNTKAAIGLLGSEKLFMEVLKNYYCAIDKKASSIIEHKNAADWRSFTIEVHALKSTSKQIGADYVSELAAKMEKAGNDGDIEYIQKNTDALMAEYLKYKEILKAIFPDVIIEQETEKSDPNITADLLNEMESALEEFDTLLIDEVIEKMSSYEYDEEQTVFFEKLNEAALNTDVDKCAEITKAWKLHLQKNSN